MRIGKIFVVLGLLMAMNLLSGCITGAVFDQVFHQTESASYLDGGPVRHATGHYRHPHNHPMYRVDTSYMYEKFSDEYCIEAFGQEVCGHDCRIGDVRSDCADGPGGECVTNDRGIVTCGYGCQSTSQELACAGGPAQACLKDAMNDITCGDNCGCTKGQATCERETYRTRRSRISRLNDVDMGHDQVEPILFRQPETFK